MLLKADTTSGSSFPVIRVSVIAALLAIHLVATFILVVPGYLSIDEALLHWMAKSFADTGGLSLWNGYDEFPSPEFRHPFLSVHNERLYPPYPYLYPILSYPFYRVAGTFGLYLMNAFAYIGLVFFCFLCVRRLFRDINLATNACLILVLAGFSWEYSQAAWPHAINMASVTAAFYLMLCGFQQEVREKAALYAFLASLVLGFGAGVRLDAVLAFPALILPFLFARPTRVMEAGAGVLGAVPGLAVLAGTHYLKFGELNPITYGQAPSAPPHFGIIIMVFVILLITWILSRDLFRAWSWRHRWWLFALGPGMLLVLIMASTEVQVFARQFLKDAYVSLVDIRALDPAISLSPMTRSAGGGVVYNGGLKKSLLQSLPYLPLLILPLAHLLKRDKDFNALVLLWIIPISVIGYHTYSFLQLEGGGGLSLNLRYLTICLPFLAILAAYGIRDIQEQWGPCIGWPSVGAVAIGVVMFFFFTVGRQGVTPDTLEVPLLVAPLVAATILTIFLFVSIVRELPQKRKTGWIGWILITATMVWAGIVGFCYDYVHHRHARSLNLSYGQQLLMVIPDDVLFVAGRGFFTASLKLKEKDRIRVASPVNDGFRDFPALLAFYLSWGKRVYAVFYESEWSYLEQTLLRQYRTIPRLSFKTFSVREITVVP